jgi:anthranilate synthase/aminodeoxychorismate synthase-like glutamine amidotransferase
MKTVGLIDHHDSFCDNLARYFKLLGVTVDFRQSDDLDALLEIPPTWTHLCVGPGPGSPTSVPHSIRMIKLAYARLPILGVCLGHQCLAQVFGGTIISSPKVHHGKTSMVTTVPDPLFQGLPGSFRVGRYHSLTVDPRVFPTDLKIIATAQDSGEIMALRHRNYPSVGIQFHPESILTEHGSALLENFIKSENP